MLRLRTPAQDDVFFMNILKIFQELNFILKGEGAQRILIREQANP